MTSFAQPNPEVKKQNSSL